MRAVVRSLSLEPEPKKLPADPREFLVLARMIIGPSDGPGEESFDVEVCSPEWLRERCAEDGFVSGRHRLVTTMESFSVSGLRAHLERAVSQVDGETWREVAERLARIAYWEFEDYRP